MREKNTAKKQVNFLRFHGTAVGESVIIPELGKANFLALAIFLVKAKRPDALVLQFHQKCFCTKTPK